MSTNSYLQLGSVEALVVRKAVKNLHLSILPPTGTVRVTAPESMKDDAIRTLLVMRLPWIKKRQAEFTGQNRQTKRKYLSGESHYFFGKRYRLEVIYKEESPKVYLKGKTKIVLQVRPKSSVAKCEEVMMDWYREEMFPLAEALMKKWEKKLGVRASFWQIKKMKTRWGSCNHDTKRILLNLELAKKPLHCIEYVVVHELLHIKERKHSEVFFALLQKSLPKWKTTKEELNDFILSYEDWER
ncbi:MAG: SprT family zinc-dependent metalloprotease [Candidatus Moraniibacteriota bacterium]